MHPKYYWPVHPKYYCPVLNRSYVGSESIKKGNIETIHNDFHHSDDSATIICLIML